MIDSEIKGLHSYDKKFFDDYVKRLYGLDYQEKFSTWKAIYFVLMAHYLRRVKLEDYYLIYDDDIIIQDDFKLITDLMLTQIPFGIVEIMNVNCDKVLLERLKNLYGTNFEQIYLNKNPRSFGFNAGFQGIDLSIYDSFLSADRMSMLLNLFDYKSVFNEKGDEIS